MSRRRIAVLLAAVLAVSATTMWAVFFALEAEPAARAVAESDGRPCRDPCAFTFGPEAAPVGLILYPGAGVEPAAYAPLAAAVADHGFLVTIQRAPLDLAVLDADMAQAAIDAHPGIDTWAVGGHSLGGAMAARFAAGSDDVAGLVLLAAYPEEALDLSQSDLAVLSISASGDPLVTPADILASAAQLPDDTVFVEVVGGNHTQFGSYGRQLRDAPASIDPEEQRRITVEAIDDLLSSLGSQPGES